MAQYASLACARELDCALESRATPHQISYPGSIQCASKPIKSAHMGQSSHQHVHRAPRKEPWSTSSAAAQRHLERDGTDGGKIRSSRPSINAGVEQAKRARPSKQAIVFVRDGEQPTPTRRISAGILTSARDWQFSPLQRSGKITKKGKITKLKITWKRPLKGISPCTQDCLASFSSLEGERGVSQRRLDAGDSQPIL